MYRIPVAWPAFVAVGVAFVFILILVLMAGDSPRQKSKSKHKKTKRKRSPTHTTYNPKRKSSQVFKRCAKCHVRITISDSHDHCFACLWMEHPMYDCVNCLAMRWKSYRTRYLRQYLWVVLFTVEKEKRPPSARLSTTKMSEYLISVQGNEEYDKMMSSASKAYKEANYRSQVSIDPSSESLQEDTSSDSQSEEGGDKQSPTKKGSSPSQSVVQIQIEQDPSQLNVSHSSPPPQGSNTQHQKSTVVQMDTAHPPSLGSQTTGQEMTGDVRPDITVESQAEMPTAQEGSSVRVGGGQSLETQGGVHSVAKETAMATRTPGASSSLVSEPKDSTLERLSRAQFFASERSSAMPRRSLDSSSCQLSGFRHGHAETAPYWRAFHVYPPGIFLERHQRIYDTPLPGAGVVRLSIAYLSTPRGRLPTWRAGLEALENLIKNLPPSVLMTPPPGIFLIS